MQKETNEDDSCSGVDETEGGVVVHDGEDESENLNDAYNVSKAVSNAFQGPA
jgi:hypothetical protein